MEKAEKNSYAIKKATSLIIKALRSKKVIFTCGNGGSASQASHLTAELLGRYKKKRRSLPSMSLNANESVVTCISNDFGYDNLFSRQLEGLGKKGDILISYSTSGKSKNILNAIKSAKEKGMVTISLLGNKGGLCKGKSDCEIIIKSASTALIQEKHLEVTHMLCDDIDKVFN
tara:strand:+ start:92 stop:610 length:519 start_codon:yes stop_codon:yes gene_type:complete